MKADFAHGFSRLEHSSFGKSHQNYQPGMLAKHAVYISRASASDRCIAINFSENTHAFRREVAEYEKSVTRKNARLAEKIVINFDKRMDAEAIDDAMRSFAIELTKKGRARFRADIHLNDPNNPHAHVLFIDTDVNTGERVNFLSDSPRERMYRKLEPNGTVWLRSLWEKNCNDVLQMHGYEFRVDMRSRLERGLDPPKEHVEWRAGDEPKETFSNDVLNESERPDPLVADAPESTELPVEPGDEQDDTEAEELPMSQRLKAALTLNRDLKWLRSVRSNIKAMEQALVLATEQADKAQTRFQVASKHAAQAEIQRREAQKVYAQRTRDGKPVGLRVKFRVPFTQLKVDYKSPTRRLSEQAIEKHHEAVTREQAALKQSKQFAEAATYTAIERDVLKVNVSTHRERLQAQLEEKHMLYGSEEQMNEAETLLAENVALNVQGIDGNQVSTMFESGELSPEEAAAAAELVGDTELAEGIRREISKGIHI